MSLLRFAPVRRAGFIIALMLAGAYMLMTLLGPNGIQALHAQNRELEALEKENAELDKLKNELKELHDALESDKETQEMYIRQKTGKTKQGETVVHIEGAEGSPGSLGPATPNAGPAQPTLLP